MQEKPRARVRRLPERNHPAERYYTPPSDLTPFQFAAETMRATKKCTNIIKKITFIESKQQTYHFY